MQPKLLIIALCCLAGAQLHAQQSAWLTWPKSTESDAEQETTAFEVVYSNDTVTTRALIYQLPDGRPGPNLWFTYVLITNSEDIEKVKQCNIRHPSPWKPTDELTEREWNDINSCIGYSAEKSDKKVTSGQIKVIKRTNPNTEHLHSVGGTQEVHELRNMKGDLLGVAESVMLCVD